MPTCTLCWVPAWISNIHEQIWWTENKLLNNICLCNKRKHLCIKLNKYVSKIQTNHRGSMQKFTSVSNLQIMCQKYQTYLCIKMSKMLFKVIRYFQRRGRGSGRPPEKSQKYRVLRNTVVWNPRKITKLRSHWRFAGGQMMAHF